MSRIRIDLDGRSAISALLGPTNTGKTHRAIQRMLSHRTGMIGLPLRLLAREVYDRVVAERGEDAVALVTGEEKRIGRAARYFVCTVESMPVDRPVDFLAVDEIQLASDRVRGHVFTERLLHARGLRQTMFLGSDSFADMMRRLVPTATIDGAARLSDLRYAGTRKLTSLPRRSAVIAFSAREIYALAERIRAHRGGVAVVLGALSPRTRNAQVAMYQSGEVPYLVATDAIGMGLNMDVDHVAFTALSKYDGRSHRALLPAEIGQIAGRAGRFRTDGTFGATARLGDLDPGLVESLEAHRFDAVRRVYWRNHALDFEDVPSLARSLAQRPPERCMVQTRDADDHIALAALFDMPNVSQRLGSPARVRLLWEVCQVPDFRKTLTGDHCEFLARIFCHLADDGRLPQNFIGKRIGRLDRVDGEIETLMARIAYVRTWSYVAFRSDWVDDAVGWQQRIRAVEDRLSDALHEALTERFVDRRAVVLGLTLARDEPVKATVDNGRVMVAGQSLGRIDGLRFADDRAGSRVGNKLVGRAVAAVLRPVMAARVQRLVEDDDEAFRFDDRGQVLWQDAVVARLARGSDLRTPAVRVCRSEHLQAVGKQQVQRRLAQWLARRVAALITIPEDKRVLEAPGRGLVYSVELGLGSVPRAEVAARIEELSKADRRRLGKLGVRMGTQHVYVTSTLRPPAIALRRALWLAWEGPDDVPPVLRGDTVEEVGRVPAGYLPRLGYVGCGPYAVRVDVMERFAAWTRRCLRDEGHLDANAAGAVLGSTAGVTVILRTLGLRRREDGTWSRARRRSRGRRRRA